MVNVDFKFTTPSSAQFKAAIDLKTLQISGGKASKAVKEGVEHSFQWFILGASGAKYAVEIVNPGSVKFKHEATLDGTGKDAGVHFFTVPAAAGGGQ